MNSIEASGRGLAGFLRCLGENCDAAFLNIGKQCCNLK